MALVLSTSLTSPSSDQPPSREEDDQVNRSAKKIKGGNTTVNSIQSWPTLSDSYRDAANKKVSFAQKLKGVSDTDRGRETQTKSIELDSEEEKDDETEGLEEEENDFQVIENPKRNSPTFVFSKKMKRKFYRAWKRSVIVKLLGRSIGFKALEGRLQTMWARRGVISLIDIGHGFFIVKLSNKQVYLEALTGGPWMVYDHYLTVRPWEPNFKAATATIDKVAVWVRFPNVFTEYYDIEALSLMGDRIGKTLKIDLNTASHLRGHYARVCVLVDLSKQLMSGFHLDGEDYYLQYEGLHLLCTRCGNYGHTAEECKIKSKEQMPSAPVDENMATTSREQAKEKMKMHQDEDSWSVVQKPRRQRKQREKQQEQSRSAKPNSRFGILVDVEEREHIVNAVEEGEAEQEHNQERTTLKRNNTAKQRRGRRNSTGKGQSSGHLEDNYGGGISGVKVGERQKETKRADKRAREEVKEGEEEKAREDFCRKEDLIDPLNSHKKQPLLLMGPSHSHLDNDQTQLPSTRVESTMMLPLEGVGPGDTRMDEGIGEPIVNSAQVDLDLESPMEIMKSGHEGGLWKGPPTKLEVPSDGRSGGLVIMWDEDRSHIRILEQDQQFFHLSWEYNQRKLFLTAVYAVPHSNHRQALWNKLKLLSLNLSEPWIVCGDFNDILNSDERLGGAGVNQGRLNWFKNQIDDCSLSDLGAVGPRFTWKGPIIQGYRRLFERLDRGLVMWMTHEDFQKFLSTSWSNPGDLETKLQQFSIAAASWNRDVFGMVEKRKRRIMARLEGIQKSNSYPYSSFLQNLEMELQTELEAVLTQEELKWFQKSRGEWVNKGDRNTRFYHLKTTITRRRNRIVALKDSNNDWVSNDKDLTVMVVDFFKKLFTEENQVHSSLDTSNCFPYLDDFNYSKLAQLPSEDEIKKAMFSMGPYKAPGVDGFPPIFFQANWRTIGIEVCRFVRGFFDGSVSIKEANKTLISLIPKCATPEYVTHFRPISLCTVHYKCVTKILTYRLKSILDRVISPFQTSFIPGRHIQDNIIIGQEILHQMDKARGKRGWVAMKIDLEKAYDRMSWAFIHQTLLLAGLQGRICELIMDCITSVSVNVLWNGSKTEFSCTQRGLRQGDPISPYIFVLCMDRLSHLISDMVEEGRWRPIGLTREGPFISHLMFADDLLFFGEATKQQVQCMLDCLNSFCSASGEKVNLGKSSIFFSRNVKPQVRSSLRNISGMKNVNDIEVYLGMPMTRSRRTTEKFRYIVEKVKDKLATWKMNCLSLAGRITLAKSVLSTIPLYPMQVAKLPVTICNEVEKLQRGFIWDDLQERKAHPIGWDKICLPKNVGGLGFRKLSSMNKACGVKIAWKLKSESTRLWADVLRHKYIYSRTGCEWEAKATDSRLWHFICQQQQILNQGICWQIRNGCTVKFFTDAWLKPFFFLKDVCMRHVSDIELESVVATWVSNGQWDYNRLSSILPPDIINMLIAKCPPNEVLGDDILIWGGNNSGQFKIKDAYWMIEDKGNSPISRVFDVIWKWKGVERIRVFLWLMVQDRLPTNERRSRWSLTSPNCPWCCDSVETITHILRDCRYAKQLWEELVHPRWKRHFFSKNLTEWVHFNLKKEIGLNEEASWSQLWGVATWKLWNWCNLHAFQPGFIKPEDPMRVILNLYKSYTFEPTVYPINSFGAVTYPIKWRRPGEDWIKCNVDGAVNTISGQAACGGVLRNSQGEWIAGFSKYLGKCSAIEAEEWAILSGMNIAWDLGATEDHC
ncbi:uncharacterized protein LOC114714409 [Neltuma alba]|uniref:uncharacterized protein LOC114714409 n=1 Tax=Neltuma alba TaxID=207710 RepID=UPI0010A47B2A|nr:uncharacterized protein LOC114714409 [Prosopis alba]